jgi:predicted nucleotide-binding protein (sugar kinase/HSP70/actin superfamily)
VNDKFVYLTAGACGPCRFGQYHESYSMALDGLGLRDFRMFLLAQDELDQGAADGGGLEINMPLSLGMIWGILCADLLMDLEYMTRPYEVNPGQPAQPRQETRTPGMALDDQLFHSGAASSSQEMGSDRSRSSPCKS